MSPRFTTGGYFYKNEQPISDCSSDQNQVLRQLFDHNYIPITIKIFSKISIFNTRKVIYGHELNKNITISNCGVGEAF